jgi:predicted amidohydrolase YtcJ
LQASLQAIRNALRQTPAPDHRTTLQHVQVARDEQFALMKRLGVSPNFLISHIYYCGDAWLKAMGGPVKGSIVNATGTAMRHGLRFGLHSDHPVTPVDRLLAMSNATNRLSINGTSVGLSERITIDAALKAITIDAAYLLGEEHSKGSIVIGKLADLTVLDRDIRLLEPKDLRTANVVATVVGGVVHKNPGINASQ